MTERQLDPDDIIPLNAFEQDFPVITDVVYAKPDHPDNVFKNLYHPKAQIMWAHKDLASVVLLASVICFRESNWKLKVDDSLRPVEAQEKMAVYGYDPSLVSLPGRGAHPRAMAIDIEPMNADTGERIDMGTVFDFFVDDPSHDNPAARDYTKLPKEVIERRQNLDAAILQAGSMLNHDMVLYPQEWWDFRFRKEVFGQFLPLGEADLKPYQRLIAPDIAALEDILAGTYPPEMQKRLDAVKLAVKEQVEKL